MEARLSLGWAQGRARFVHPIYDPLRHALARLAEDADWPDHARLNALAAALGGAPRVHGGPRIRFVPPLPGAAGYEQRIHASGEVATRPRNWHDLFNTLAWLAFPRTKASLNAIHASEMALRSDRRGPTRDLLTIFDEGGAVVACSDPELLALIRAFRWQSLFWDARPRVLASLRIIVFGHAVLEKALDPWAGITCKALLVPVDEALLRAPADVLSEIVDAAAAAWFDAYARTSSPRDLSPLPVFGFPGWSADDGRPEYYANARYFRPQPRRDLERAGR
ncbi:MAG: DUF3025 domain-containing protein [Burkholderiales bacterium]|nr:DUF3025 domain-containing protein [Burkholderiales bacterium]